MESTQISLFISDYRISLNLTCTFKQSFSAKLFNMHDIPACFRIFIIVSDNMISHPFSNEFFVNYFYFFLKH